MARSLVIAIVALISLVLGCGSEQTLEIPHWTLHVGKADPCPITLPVHLDARLPAEPSTYTLRTTVVLPPELRGKDLVLAIPRLPATTELVTGGRAIAAIEADPSYAYRSAGPHAWRIPHDLTEASPLDLELVITHRWRSSAWFDSIPRLSATAYGDPGYRRLSIVNALGGAAALGTLFPLGLAHLFLFLLDRRRTQHGWAALQALAASTYPAFVVGYSQLFFGTLDIGLLAIGQAVSPIAGMYFTRARFKLKPPPRIYGVLILVVCAIALLESNAFAAGAMLGPAVMIVSSVAVGHHVFTLAWLTRQRPRPNHSLMLLSVWLIGLCALGLDGPSWLGLGEPFGGLRAGCWGLALIGILQTGVVATDHSVSLNRADALNIELAERVLLLETRQSEIQRLNDELRRQIEDRSRHIEAAFARIAADTGETADLSPGDLVEQRYRVVRAIGAGGMGCVYEVVRVTDDRRLALKVLTTVSGSAEVARFAREARIAASVDHPNVVAIVDVDIASSGYLYLVMEFVEGASLAESHGRFGDTKWALEILRQVGRGLAAIHARGIVHRDLKPSNVLLSGGTSSAVATAKISDFGVSTLAMGALPPDAPAGPCEKDDVTMHLAQHPVDGSSNESSMRSPLTRSGVVMGTPVYMAPEQASGAKSATRASDIFSLGVIAFEILTGRRPFVEPPALAALKGHALPGSPPPLATLVPDLDADVAALLDRTLALEPAGRPSASEIVGALGGVVKPGA